MQFLLGALAMALFSCAMGTAYIYGKRSRPRAAPQTREVDEQERRRAERLKQGFSELMSYDVTTALKGKR